MAKENVFPVYSELSRVMRAFLVVAIFLLTGKSTLYAQASVGYYPWSSLLTVSTNPSRAIWGDVRFQTNSLFSSLSVDLLPMVNLKRGEVVQVYLGGGVRLNPLYRIADPEAKIITIDGYSMNLGVRIAPLPKNRQVQLAVELNPFVKREFASGVLKSHFGLVYVFKKKSEKVIVE